MLVLALPVVGVIVYRSVKPSPSPTEQIARALVFDQSVSDTEKEAAEAAIVAQDIDYDGTTTAAARTTFAYDAGSPLLGVYVPVTSKYAARQTISKADLSQQTIYLAADTDATIKTAVAQLLQPLRKLVDSGAWG